MEACLALGTSGKMMLDLGDPHKRMALARAATEVHPVNSSAAEPGYQGGRALHLN